MSFHVDEILQALDHGYNYFIFLPDDVVGVHPVSLLQI